MKIPEYLTENNDLIDVDLFNRDIIVDSIYNYIIENENTSPIKIGIYGDWGIGKTYLLKLLQKKIRNKNGLFRFLKTRREIVFLDIKNPESFQEFRRQFFNDIKQSICLFYDSIYEIFKYAIYGLFLLFFIGFIIRIVQNAINSEDILSWDNAKNGFFVILATAIISQIGKKCFDVVSSYDLFNNYNKSLDELYVILYLLRKRFMGSKVIVVIDDLDRVDAKYVPEILVWLNRISTIKKGIVNIIIVADPSKLGQGIQSSFTQYSQEEGYEFLEKVVDTPYYLDKLLGSGKYLFWNTYKNQLISDFQPLEAIENFLDYLPENIRQLKRYFRFIYILIDDLKRFGPNEIDFETLFFIQLMKLEHPQESLHLIELIVENKIFFTPGIELGQERAKELKDRLSEIQKRYFSYFEGRYINRDKISEYYYFVQYTPKITDKEFHSTYILGDKKINDLIKVFNGDLSRVLLSLANYKQLYYSKLINEKTTDLMHEYQGYVEKVYSLIELIIGSITDQLVLNPTDFSLIFNGITSYGNFITDIAGLEYEKHRQTESKLIDKLLKIIHPETLFFNTLSDSTHKIDEKINEIYWEYLINKLGQNIYENKIFDHQVRYLLYKKIFLGNGIQELLSVEINDKVMHNYYFILYNLLIQVKESNSNDTSKVLEVLKSNGFKELVSKISFATINPRSLGSFEQDVLEAMPQQYENSIRFLIDKVKELSPRHQNV